MSCDQRDLWVSAGGYVPAHWEFSTVADLLQTPKSISVGVMYPGPDTSGGVRLVRVADVKAGQVTRPEFCISNEVDEEYKRTRLNGNELLVTLVGNPGDCVIVTEEMAGWNAARAVAVLRLKDPDLRQWLRYVLLSEPAKHLIDSRLNTTVQKTLNLKDIKELPVPIAPQAERERISDIVSAFESKSLINHKTNQTLEQIAQAIFKSWFVDFEPVKAKQHARALGGNDAQTERAAQAVIAGAVNLDIITTATDLSALDQQLNKALSKKLAHQTEAQREQLAITASHFPDQLVASELGLIPKGWEVRQLPELIDFLEGPGIRNWQYTVEENGVKFINIRCIKSGDLKLDTANKITEKEAFGKYAHFQLQVDDIVVSTSGTLGRFAFVREAHLPLSLNTSVIRFRPVAGVTTLHFIRGFVETQLQLELEMRASGSAQRNFGPMHLKQIRLLTPNIALLKLHAAICEPLYRLRQSNLTEIDQVHEMRDALLPKLLSGELDLSGAYRNTAKVV